MHFIIRSPTEVGYFHTNALVHYHFHITIRQILMKLGICNQWNIFSEMLLFCLTPSRLKELLKISLFVKGHLEQTSAIF